MARLKWPHGGQAKLQQDSEALKDSAQEVAFALGVIGVLAIPWGKLVASLLGITGVATGSFGFIDPVEGSDSESSGCTDEN